MLFMHTVQCLELSISEMTKKDCSAAKKERRPLPAGKSSNYHDVNAKQRAADTPSSFLMLSDQKLQNTDKLTAPCFQ